MHVEFISNSNFEGKLKFDKNLNVKEKRFIKRLMQYEKEGISNEKYLKNAKFDIEVNKVRQTKRTVHPSIKLYGVYKVMMLNGYFKGQTNRIYSAKHLRIDNNFETLAENFRQFMEELNHITSTRRACYYSNFEKIKLKYELFKDSLKDRFSQTIIKFLNLAEEDLQNF